MPATTVGAPWESLCLKYTFNLTVTQHTCFFGEFVMASDTINRYHYWLRKRKIVDKKKKKQWEQFVIMLLAASPQDSTLSSTRHLVKKSLIKTTSQVAKFLDLCQGLGISCYAL